jgi:hypothetical protein
MPYTVLRKLVKECGSQKAAARKLRISAQYLNDVLQGRREMSEALASKLGFKRVVTFRPKGGQ